LKVLITGVAGFLGSHLADRFLQDGHEVIGVDNLLGGYRSNVPDGVAFVEMDLLDLEKVNSVFSDVELVIHTACTAYEGLSVFSPSLIVANTTQITTNVISAAVRNNVKKIVYMSSMARYGTQEKVPFIEEMTPAPQDPYGIAKYASELLLKNLCEVHGLDYVILVPHNIIGPRQKFDDPYRNVASIMINRMLAGKQPIIYGTGEQRRCFSFIADVVEPLYAASFSKEAISKTINIGPDEEFVSINQLAQAIAKILSFDLDPIYMDGRPQEVFEANCSADLARKILSYNTKTNLHDGLVELVDWIKVQGFRPFSYHLPLEIINEKTPKSWKDQLM
jgi:UDP-glucose 4-epimerase